MKCVFERLRVAMALLAGRVRARALALRGAKVGAKARIGARCRFDRPWCIELGDRVEIEDHVSVKVTSDGARLRIGAFSFLGRGTELDVSREIVVGDHTLLAPGCFITDHSHRFSEPFLRIDEQGCVEAAVRIGNDAWIGAHATILMGVSIGHRSIVGAGSVVRRDVPAGEVHAGVPARKRGTRP
jgi:acetyltransferase-like isoleucine patch superfamily enzyme